LNSDRVFLLDSSSIILPGRKPLYSFLLNTKPYNSGEVSAVKINDLYSQTFKNNLWVTYKTSDHSRFGWRGELTFENKSNDTVSISNVVPFGQDSSSVYITGQGPSDLARAWLFRPGFRPVRVILPDNAWELGYSSFFAGKGYSVCSVARRFKIEGGQKQRYETVLPPKAKVTYSLYAEVFKGE